MPGCQDQKFVKAVKAAEPKDFLGNEQTPGKKHGWLMGGSSKIVFSWLSCYPLKVMRKWVVWIAQSGKELVFIREVLGSNPRANHIPGVCRLSPVEMWTLVKSWSKMVRACNSHAQTGSDTLRGLVRWKGLEWYFPAVGQVRFLASQEVWSFWSVVM